MPADRDRDETTLRIVALIMAIVGRMLAFLAALWLVSLTGLLRHVDQAWVMVTIGITVTGIVVRQGYREHRRGHSNTGER